MKPLSRTLYTESLYSNSSTTATGVTTVTETLSSNVPNGSVTVTCPTSNKGDKKTTTPFSYTVVRDEPLDGSVRSISKAVAAGDLRAQTLITTGPGVFPLFGGAKLQPDFSGLQRNRDLSLSRLLGEVRRLDLDVASNVGEASTFADQNLDRSRKDSDTFGLQRRMGTPANPRWRSNELRAFRNVPIGLLKTAGSAWLIWKYCIKPAIDDAWDASMVLIEDQNSRVIFKGSARLNLDQSISYSDGRGLYHRSSVEGFHKVKYKAVCRVANPLLYTAQTITSFNPALIAWNAMPLSFVADWFLDLGGYMQELETSMGLGLDIEDICNSRLLHYKLKNTYGGSYSDTLDGLTTTRFQSLNSSYHYSAFVRERLTTFPRPTPPAFRPKLGTSRLLSAAALLSGFLK